VLVKEKLCVRIMQD